MAEHRYLWDSSDDTLCRLRDGVATEVWQPRAGRWVPFDFNPWTDCSEVTVQQARDLMRATYEAHGGVGGADPFDSRDAEDSHEPLRFLTVAEQADAMSDLVANVEYVDPKNGERYDPGGLPSVDDPVGDEDMR